MTMIERNRFKRILFVAALLLISALAVLRSMHGTALDGFTPDEPYHVVAGVSYVARGDYRLNPEHPPLVKLIVGWASADLMTLRPFEPLDDKRAERDFTEATFYEDNNAVAVQARVRAVLFAFHGMLLVILGLLLWRVFGGPWALVALIWLAVEPSVGAHLPVAMTDLALGLLLPIAALTAALMVNTGRWLWVLAFGLAAGLALAAKHSAIPGLTVIGLVVVAMVLIAATRGARAGMRRLGQAGCAALLALVVLWAHYGFQFHAAPDGSDPFNRALADKIEDLNSPLWRTAIKVTDSIGVVPRPYLWGLADTVRAGVEGRGQSRHYLYGQAYEGHPPWYFWLGILSAKIPIPLLLLSLLGLLAIAIQRPRGIARLALVLLGLCALGHYLVLAGAQGTYGGVRHAMPVLAILGVLAGGVCLLNQGRPRQWSHAISAVALSVTVVLTIKEPRLWEYHNEFAGGTANAANGFDNEGLMLGQRVPEIAAYWHSQVPDRDTTPLYVWTWMEEEERAYYGLPDHEMVESIEDDNHAGHYAGYFIIEAGSFRPWSNWDPSLLDDLEEVKRFGNLHLMKGPVMAPRFRAGALWFKVREYLAETDEPDWATVAARLREVSDIYHWWWTPPVLLGNAHVALGQRAQAKSAYQEALDRANQDIPFRARLQEQVALLDSDLPISEVHLLRDPTVE